MFSKIQKKPRFKKNKPSDKSHLWFAGILIFGLFFGVTTFSYVGHYTLISIKKLSQILLFFCFIGLLLPFKWYKSKFNFGYFEVIAVNIVGIGPLVSSVLLWINFLFYTSSQTQQFKIISEITSIEMYAGTSVLFTLQNNQFVAYDEIRRFDIYYENQNIRKGKFLKINLQKGILGYTVFNKREVILQ